MHAGIQFTLPWHVMPKSDLPNPDMSCRNPIYSTRTYHAGILIAMTRLALPSSRFPFLNERDLRQVKWKFFEFQLFAQKARKNGDLAPPPPPPPPPPGMLLIRGRVHAVQLLTARKEMYLFNHCLKCWGTITAGTLINLLLTLQSYCTIIFCRNTLH